jgi:Pyruvate/2-oxoacid:ferredoxin oxidoreductase gamma subunit
MFRRGSAAVERELLLTGIGGQGVQLATQVLARALTLDGRYVMSLGTYGGSMRGGNTDSSLVFADAPVSAPPIVARAWSGLAMHHRFWADLKSKLVDGGLLLANAPVVEPDQDVGRFRYVEVPAVAIATGLGAAMGASMVMAGAYAKATGAVGLDSLRQAMAQSLPPYRQKHLASNIAMLEAGYAHIPSVLAPAWGEA